MRTLQRPEPEVPLQVLIEAPGDARRSAGPGLHGDVVDTVVRPLKCARASTAAPIPPESGMHPHMVSAVAPARPWTAASNPAPTQGRAAERVRRVAATTVPGWVIGSNVRWRVVLML